jgi:hypothetical protein
MLVVAFLRWWYGPGWHDTSQQVLKRVRHLYLDFSVPILLRTLFAPWRRIMTPKDGPLTQKLRAMLDNLISRFVGLGVRLIALFTGCLLMGLTLAAGGLLALLWPIIPPLSVALILLGIVL